MFGSISFDLRDHYEWEEASSCFDNDGVQKENEDITGDNLESYIQRTIDFAMNKGIRKQMDAFICKSIANY